MKITVTRSGGIAGTIATATVDTDDLPPDRAAAITAIVERTTATDDRSAMMPDAFQYDVTIEDDNGTKSLRHYGDPCPAAALFTAIREMTA